MSDHHGQQISRVEFDIAVREIDGTREPYRIVRLIETNRQVETTSLDCPAALTVLEQMAELPPVTLAVSRYTRPPLAIADGRFTTITGTSQAPSGAMVRFSFQVIGGEMDQWARASLEALEPCWDSVS
ncbi:hypothetical protein [Brevundimonas sp.]|uniref:hypothetical protein n=1 Tax=Brevundimonas sp. TaxID=1871086 RepID=UPI00391C0C28